MKKRPRVRRFFHAFVQARVLRRAVDLLFFVQFAEYVRRFAERLGIYLLRVAPGLFHLFEMFFDGFDAL